MKKTLTALALGALLLPASLQAEPISKELPTKKADLVDNSIVGIAAGNPDFSTLVAAVKAADLAGALGGDGPFTVFAPVNSAFDKLPSDAVADLLKPENKAKLQDILKYHVVPGKVMASDVKPGEVVMLNGKKSALSVKDGAVMIDGAKIIKTDVAADNGVIHIIDSVIMPKG